MVFVAALLCSLAKASFLLNACFGAMVVHVDLSDDEESDQEMQDWDKVDKNDDCSMPDLPQEHQQSSAWSSSSKSDLRRDAPAEVQAQILAACSLEEKPGMTEQLQKSTRSLTQRNRDYPCAWCKVPGFRSQRLPCQYTTKEWKTGIFLLCFDCCQGCDPDDCKERDATPARFYGAQPVDCNFELLELKKTKQLDNIT